MAARTRHTSSTGTRPPVSLLNSDEQLKNTLASSEHDSPESQNHRGPASRHVAHEGSLELLNSRARSSPAALLAAMIFMCKWIASSVACVVRHLRAAAPCLGCSLPAARLSDHQEFECPECTVVFTVVLMRLQLHIKCHHRRWQRYTSRRCTLLIWCASTPSTAHHMACASSQPLCSRPPKQHGWEDDDGALHLLPARTR
jgi:hypothetical protein